MFISGFVGGKVESWWKFRRFFLETELDDGR